MTGRLRLSVKTPTGVLYEDDVDAVTVPIADGWIGILPGHAPFMARLMTGQVAFRAAGRERTIATTGGTLSVKDDVVNVLTGVGEVDAAYSELERNIGAEGARIQSMELEAEKHFDRVYRAMADTFRRQRRNA